jgi:hypothetical protein
VLHRTRHAACRHSERSKIRAREAEKRGATKFGTANPAKHTSKGYKFYGKVMVLTKNIFTFAAEHIKKFVPMTYTAQ